MTNDKLEKDIATTESWRIFHAPLPPPSPAPPTPTIDEPTDKISIIGKCLSTINSTSVAQIEQHLTTTAAKLGPWLAPIPPAFFVARAAERHLAAPQPVAIIMAIAIELIGISATTGALRAYTYNNSKRKSDPRAPLTLTLSLAAGYLAIGVTLSTLLEMWPELATVTPALFFVLAGIGYSCLAISADQNRREAEIKQQKAKRRRDGRPRTSTDIQEPQPSAIQADPELDALIAKININGNIFSPTEAQEVTALGRSKTYEMLKYGQETDQIQRVGKGKYQRNGT